MKRYTRALAFALLFAIVLTAFGMFSTFAESEEDEKKEYGKIVYDMDAQTTISVSQGANGPFMERNADGYWDMNYRGIHPSMQGVGNGDYWVAQPSSSIYVNNKYTEKEVTDADGNVTTVKEVSSAKNTDYFVIDFDISTDTSLLDGIYFHNRWLTNSGGKAQQNYVQLNGTDLDSFYISTHQGGSCLRPATTPGEWLNVTIVYDFSSVDAEGYAVPADWKVHVYFDGVYAGVLPNIHAGAVSFYFNRVSTDAGCIQNGPDASTLFANFTYKVFERGYEGEMTQPGVLGYTGITLADIPELAYCLEDTPVKADKLIATIEREGVAEPIEVYKYDELDASLQDGDVVILERSITESLVIDSGATVTFKDKNGTVLTPGTYTDGDLVYIKQPYTVDFTSGTVLRRTNSNYRKKNVTDKTTTFSYSVLSSYAPVGSTSTLNYTYTLLADVEYASTSTAKVQSDKLLTDLNGYKLTMTNTKRAFDCTSSSTYATLLFKNGTVELKGSEITMFNATTTVAFDNVDLTIASTSLFDQRGGIVIYNNCKVTANQAITNLKGSGNIRGSVIVKDSDVTVTGESAILVSNTSSSSQRQGSLNAFVRISGSNVSAATAGNVVNVTSYANATGTYGADADTGEATFTATNEAYIKNDNNIGVYIAGSDVSAPTSALVSTNVAEFRAVKGSSRVDANENYSLVTDFVITDSKITSKYLVYQAAGGYLASLKYQDNYEYTTNITLSNTDLYMDMASSTLVVRQSKLPNTAFNLIIGEEVSCPTNDESKFISSEGGAHLDNYNLVYAAEAIWVKRSLEGAPAYTYTNKLDTHAYIYDGHEYEFIAYLGDPVTELNIPQALPEESSILKYEWEYNIDGAWEAVATYKGSIKANLTASSDLALHIYLPADFSNPEVYDMIYVEGYKMTVRDVVHDGVAYKAVTIPGIDPSSALKDFTVRFRVADENGAEATVEREISVLDYIKAALESESLAAEDKTLVASVLNYIAAAAAYNNPGVELDPVLAELLASSEYTAITLPDAAAPEAKISVKDLGIFSSARVVLDTRFTYELMVKEDFAGDITLTYLKDGVTETKTVSVVGGDIVRVELLAYEMTSAVTVTCGADSGEINLAGYMSIMPEGSVSDELLALADAIGVYNAAAAACMQ